MTNSTLATHNIRVLFWISFFGTISFLQPVLTLFYFERGLTSSDILIVLMFWSGAVLLGEVPTGIFADRFGAKYSFLFGSFLKFLSITLLLFAYEPWMFFIYSFINGFSVTFFSGADEALIYDSLKESNEENRMDHAMGKIQSASFISMLIAVLFGSYLAKDLVDSQFTLLILLGLAFHLIELFLILSVKQPSVDSFQKENPFSQIKSGIRVIRQAPQLLLMFLNVTLVFIPAGAVYQYFDQPLLQDAGVPVYLIGVFYAVSAILGYIASNSIGWMTARFSRVMLMNISGLSAVAGLFISGLFGSSLWIVLGSFFLLRLVRAIRYPIYSQLSNDLIPSGVRATTISLLSIVDSGLDLVVFGVLSTIALNGYSYVLIGCAFIALVGTLLPIRPVNTKESLKIKQSASL
ncbi:MFS transporter [Rossellomorea vietnamensis]|uniref:MFS transporter n=1 Tax=Rossellomorea TaxID=2837508 RepID=UPI001CCFF406|nr:MULTISPECIES: MFS transporter [Rossellomorea]MCA0148077.1 MFS transporter [Rossellomorea vietnamensis]UTE75905.1 MFS transporter [Rossellomorea sp. KS-H15a]